MQIFHIPIIPTMKKPLIILICILTTTISISQSIQLGGRFGYIPHSINPKDANFLSPQTFSVGLLAEYTPQKALFTISSEIQYLGKLNQLILPISINLTFGKIIRPRITWGAIPMIRLSPEYPDVVFGFGMKTGGGIDFRITDKISISTGLEWM